MVLSLFEKLLLEFSSLQYRDELIRARRQFQKFTGVVKDDSKSYIEKLDQFASWYLIDYELSNVELSPLNYYYERHISQLSTEELSAILSLKNASLELFKVLSIKGERIKLLNLFNKYRLDVLDELSYYKILRKGDIISARVFKHKRETHFLPGILVHPEESFFYIERKVKELMFLDKAYIKSFIERLLLMRLKIEEYDYINIRDIYRDQPRIQF